MSYGIQMGNRDFTESSNYKIEKIITKEMINNGYIYSNDILVYYKDVNKFKNAYSHDLNITVFKINEVPRKTSNYGAEIGSEEISKGLYLKTRKTLTKENNSINYNSDTDLIFLKSNNLETLREFELSNNKLTIPIHKGSIEVIILTSEPKHSNYGISKDGELIVNEHTLRIYPIATKLTETGFSMYGHYMDSTAFSASNNGKYFPLHLFTMYMTMTGYAPIPAGTLITSDKIEFQSVEDGGYHPNATLSNSFCIDIY